MQMIKLKKPILIAEIGINHNGSIELAKKMIDLASKYKMDVVKFQKRDPNICVPDKYKDLYRETPWGNMTYLEYKKKIEFGRKEFDVIHKYCKKKKLNGSLQRGILKVKSFLKNIIQNIIK